eukprot:gene7754-9262_t
MLALFIVTLGAVGSLVQGANVCDEYDKVNPFIGTGGLAYGYGGINPGAQLPFSPLRLGPDTTDTVVDLSYRHFSGYNYNDRLIRGFSHTHLVGGGVNDLGNIGFMPTAMDKDTDMLKLPILSAPFWWSSFDKSSESAAPGFYSVQLTTPRVQVDLTAISSFAGVHNYKWSREKDDKVPTLVLDMCHEAKIETGDDAPCTEAHFTLDASASKFTGAVHKSHGLSGNIWIYISGEIAIKSKDQSVSSVHTCTAASAKDNTATCTTDRTAESTSGVLFSVLRFDTPTTATAGESGVHVPLEVEIKVGISFISEAMATQNLQDAQSETTDVRKLAERTKHTWCNLLNEMQVDVLPGLYGTSNSTVDDLEVVVHSAHYRSMMSPTTYTESGGLYLGMDKVVHNVTSERLAKYGATGTWYSDFSLWDTVRSQHPWQLLRNERYAVDFARSLAEMTVQQNSFPRWPLASNEASCMIGESGAAVIVELILNGMGDLVDVAAIQPIFLTQSTEPVALNGRSDVEHYMQYGYVSQDVNDKASSNTLSYAFDDYLLAKMSEYVGDTKSAQEAMKRSKNYQNIWSPEKSLFCPKYADGSLVCPDSGDSPKSWGQYTEGDAFHWSWFVPHDPEGLIALYGSKEAYLTALEAFFVNHVPYDEKFGNAKPNNYYWAGNEHDFLAPWLFNFAGACTRSQYWGRRLLAMHFTNKPNGIPGNEDYGSMATWSLFATLGLYPQAGTTRFMISAPSVNTASIQLTHLKPHAASTLEIVTYNNTVENTFVEKLLVNGVEHKESFIDRAVLAAPGGCKLEFFMSAQEVSSLCSQ